MAEEKRLPWWCRRCPDRWEWDCEEEDRDDCGKYPRARPEGWGIEGAKEEGSE